MLRTLVLPWQKEPQGRIFISYRRDDTQWVAGRLSDSLSQYFGDKRVFRDIEGIGGGADFSEVIRGTLGEADAAVILVGEGWIDATDEAGQRRLDDPDDWVVQEIATALEAGIPVYPVLVEDTQMPRTDALPERLRPLIRLNAITVSDKRWDSDVARLAKIVGLDIPSVTERKLQGINLLISLALVLTVLATCTILFLEPHLLYRGVLPALEWVVLALYQSGNISVRIMRTGMAPQPGAIGYSISGYRAEQRPVVRVRSPGRGNPSALFPCGSMGGCDWDIDFLHSAGTDL